MKCGLIKKSDHLPLQDEKVKV